MLKAEIRYAHESQAARALAPVSFSQRAPLSRRRDSSSSSASSKQGVCYAFNGESAEHKWTNSNQCRRVDQCKFAHKCMICRGEDHACYDRAECASKPRARAPPRPRR